MNKALLFIFCVVLIGGCKKNQGSGTPLVKLDSLGTGWTKVQTGANGFISDVFFIGNTGFCISSNSIYKSTNGGDTWLKIFESNPASTNNFENIGMGNADNACFASGTASQYMFFTTNGGAGFDSTKLPEYNYYDIFYVSPQIVYAINGKLWKSTNGGKTWSSIYTFPGSTTAAYETLFFLNEQVGWARSHTSLFKTIDGGVSWTPITNTGLTSTALGSLFFVDENNGYISNDNTVKRTTDGGATWSTVYTSTLGKSYHDLHFFTPQTGYLTDNQLILKTTDGGATWKKEVAMALYLIGELHFTDENHGWAGTNNGIVLKFTK